MFVLYSVLISAAFVVLDLLFFKTFQLTSYRVKRYIKSAKTWFVSLGRKTPLVFTMRVKRLILCDFLLKFCIFLLFFALISKFWVNFAIVLLLLLFAPILAIFTFWASMPIENLIKKNIIKKAKRKLSKSACKVIAITGSFGKTSTKNFLYQILKEEFETTASPKSFNTPMGVCRTILENLKETDDFLILEFGARAKGDIEECAKLVNVDFGIITPIGNCHLETFGSLQNIEDTKYELCENCKDLMVFNAASKASKRLFEKYPRRKFLVCEEGSFAYAENLRVSARGSTFDLVIANTKISCSSKVLGKANIDNIVVASAMAYLLGETLFGIRRGIEKLMQTPHRLELIRGEFVNVIDDSYNSNLQGFKEALSVLKQFEGRKIVVSPGIVELGKMQHDVNVEAAQEVGKVADVFVIMNEVNKKALFEGAEGKCEILYATTREGQKALLRQILRKGDVVLFENDLPDNMK